MGIHDDRAWNEAWDEAYPGSDGAPDTKRRRRRLFRGAPPQLRSVMVATGMLVLGVSGIGVAQSTGVVELGERNGTATDETEIIANEGAGTGRKGGYSTRQSNLSSTGGGAIYGCRSGEGGTPANNLPCVRANNLRQGLAFEFAFEGPAGGSITSRVAGDSRKPFTTNATGVADGLNADEVDGASLSDILAASQADAQTRANAATERFVTVRENAQGTGAFIVAQSGGFSLVNCYQTNGNCYISAGSDVTNRAITTEILTDNTDNPGPDGPIQLSATTSAAPCFADYVNCGPPGTDSNNGGDNGVFVVTPRNPDGTDPGAGDRYGFTAVVSAATAG